MPATMHQIAMPIPSNPRRPVILPANPRVMYCPNTNVEPRMASHRATDRYDSEITHGRKSIPGRNITKWCLQVTGERHSDIAQARPNTATRPAPAASQCHRTATTISSSASNTRANTRTVLTAGASIGSCLRGAVERLGLRSSAPPP